MGIRYLWRRFKYFATHQSVQAAYREEAGSNGFCCDDVDSQDFAHYTVFSGHVERAGDAEGWWRGSGEGDCRRRWKEGRGAILVDRCQS